MGTAAPREIDWDRLDKRRFFVVGVGLFSGVTTTLYPLTVIKTRQMAAHTGVSAGLGGTRLIAQKIWAEEGVRGFYRGFGTVVFGTIPARTVYLSSLEMTKAAVQRLGSQLDVPPAALSGIASFAGGAAASASTQAVVVPIDVISQRLMMHGVADSSSGSSSGAAAGGTAVAAGGSSKPVPTAAGGGGGGVQQPAAAAAPPGAQQGGAAGVRRFSSLAGSSVQQRHHQQQLVQARASAWLHVQQQQQCSSSGSSSSAQPARCSSSRGVAAAEGLRHLRTSSPPSAAAAAGTRMNGFTMARLIVAQEGVAGLYRGFLPSLATFVPNSALWWGAYGAFQPALFGLLPAAWLGGGGSSGSSGSSGSGGSSGGGAPSTGTVVAVQTLSAVLAGASTSVLTNPLDLVKTRLQVAVPVNGVVPRWSHLLRELLAEEGPRGLLRGVAPRMASSALWGTAMVSVYELLKRMCAVPAE